MQKYQASLVVKMSSILAEGPVWHPLHKKLYWVDIQKREVHQFDVKTNLHRLWNVGKRVGAIAAATQETLILALQGEIAMLDVTSGAIKGLAELEPHLPDNRSNDGKCDAAGRFWIGTMHVDALKNQGSLYCIDGQMNVTRVLKNTTISNGLGWSLKNDHMYFIDSKDRNVKRYDFSLHETALKNEKVIITFKNLNEEPDGMCIDSEGMLWIAFWGGNRVGRYDPASGEQLAEIEVPAPNVTSCTFGDDDLNTLYITTAREGLSPAQLDEYPLSGSIFSCAPGVGGIKATLFRRQS